MVGERYIGVQQREVAAVKYLEMASLTELRSLDTVGRDAGVLTDVHGDSTPVAAVERREEQPVAVHRKAVAVLMAPDFLQAKKVRRIIGGKSLYLVETPGNSVDVPADKKHDKT